MDYKNLFPVEGNVRAKQAALFLGIGLSTFWLMTKQKRIKKPIKHIDGYMVALRFFDKR